MADQRFLAYIIRPEPELDQHDVSPDEVRYSLTQARDGTLRVAGHSGPPGWEHMPTAKAVDLRDANRIAHEHWQRQLEVFDARQGQELAESDARLLVSGFKC